MFKKRFAAIAAITTALVAGTAQGQQQTAAKPAPGGPVPDGKVVVINTNVFPGQIAELKLKYEQVSNQFKERNDRLNGIEAQLRQMESDIRTKGPGLTADVLAQKQNEFEDLKKKGTRDFEDLKAEVDRALEAATKPVRDKLFQFLEKFSQQRGFVLVLNLAGIAQSQSLAYWHPAADITDEFVAEYNRANPVAASPAAPPAGANRPAVKPNNR